MQHAAITSSQSSRMLLTCGSRCRSVSSGPRMKAITCIQRAIVARTCDCIWGVSGSDHGGLGQQETWPEKRVDWGQKQQSRDESFPFVGSHAHISLTSSHEARLSNVPLIMNQLVGPTAHVTTGKLRTR